MNSEFLKEQVRNPILSTLKLSYRMFQCNKVLFALVSGIFIIFASSSFLTPISFMGIFGHVPIVYIFILSGLITLLSQIFMVSNYLYVGKLFMESNSEDVYIEKIKNIKVSKLFFEYFVRASGSLLAIILVVLPLFIIGKEFYMGEYWNIFLKMLSIFALYIYAIVVYKIILSSNFKEAFFVTFSLLSLTTWKKSLCLPYAKFLILLATLLYGVYFIFMYSIESISLDVSFTAMTIAIMITLTILSVFIALYILPITMILAYHLIVDTK